MSDLLNIGYLLRLARETVSDPKGGAREVMDLHLSRQALILMFAIVVVLSLILGEIVALMAQLPTGGDVAFAFRSPLVLGLLQGVFLLVTAYAMTFVGRLFGGVGSFNGALALVVWLQFIFICIQIVQIGALLLIPPVAGLITILALGLFFWLLVNFIAALHGFTSTGMVFVMTIVSSIVILFLLGLVLTMLGLSTDLQGF
jgi:hypothetical protein